MLKFGPLLSLNVGAAIQEDESGKVSFDDAMPLPLLMETMDALLMMKWTDFCSFAEQRLVCHFFRGLTMGSIISKMRPLSQCDRVNNLTQKIIDYINCGAKIELEESLWQSHHQIPDFIICSPELQMKTQCILVSMWAKLYKKVAETVGPIAWRHFIETIPIQESSVDIVKRAAQQIISFTDDFTQVVFLQEFRETDFFLQQIKQVYRHANLYYSANPTKSTPTTAILVMDTTKFSEIEIVNTELDPKRVCAIRLHHGTECTLAISFHGDTTGSPSINQQVCKLIDDCETDCIYGGDYQGGKSGADRTIFPGLLTEDVVTRLTPPQSPFGFNQGIKFIEKN